MKLAYQAIFTPFSDGTEGYVVEFPDLPGCVTEGYSIAEALYMAEDAASGWVLTELENGKQPPMALDHSMDCMKKGQFMSYVALDMDTYAEKYGNRAVKKTLTIPAWLNTFVEEHNISCSKVLKESLTQIAQQSFEETSETNRH